jgi:hypothetical protein
LATRALITYVVSTSTQRLHGSILQFGSRLRKYGSVVPNWKFHWRTMMFGGRCAGLIAIRPVHGQLLVESSGDEADGCMYPGPVPSDDAQGLLHFPDEFVRRRGSAHAYACRNSFGENHVRLWGSQTLDRWPCSHLTELRRNHWPRWQSRLTVHRIASGICTASLFPSPGSGMWELRKLPTSECS